MRLRVKAFTLGDYALRHRGAPSDQRTYPGLGSVWSLATYIETHSARGEKDREDNARWKAMHPEQRREVNRVQTNRWREKNPERSKEIKREWARRQRERGRHENGS